MSDYNNVIICYVIHVAISHVIFKIMSHSIMATLMVLEYLDLLVLYSKVVFDIPQDSFCWLIVTNLAIRCVGIKHYLL